MFLFHAKADNFTPRRQGAKEYIREAELFVFVVGFFLCAFAALRAITIARVAC